MWVFCDRGFFSIVANEKAQAIHSDMLCVRSRVREDLVRLCQDLELNSAKEIKGREFPSQDYPYRVFLHRDDVALWLGSRVGRIAYPNFKSMVLAAFGYARETIYAQVWSRLLQLEKMEAAGQEGRDEIEPA